MTTSNSTPVDVATDADATAPDADAPQSLPTLLPLAGATAASNADAAGSCCGGGACRID